MYKEKTVKKMLVLAAAMLLSGCNMYVSGATVQASQFVCRNAGGVSHINTLGDDMIRCNSGKRVYIRTAYREYSEYLEAEQQITDSNVQRNF